jgi:putative transposase
LTALQLKQLASYIIDNYKVSQRRACMTVELRQNTFRYKLRRREDLPVRGRIKEIATTYIRYGQERIYKLLKREGWPDNHKRVRRIYREEELNLRSKRPRRSKAAARRMGRPDPTEVNECWAMDFVQDQLFDGKKFRAITIVDIFSRFCLAIEVKRSFKGIDVVEVMESLKTVQSVKPKTIRLDNGSEFIGKDLDNWASFNGVTLDFSRKGKPTDNAYCESFNGTFRDECLNTSWFLSLEDAIGKIDTWRTEYNTFRQHSSINDMTPEEMIIKHTKSPKNSNLK